MYPEPHQGQPLVRLDDQQRARIFDQAVTRWLMGGGQVVSRTEFEVVIAYRRKVNHVLHLLLTVLTCGMWGVIWLILAIANPGETRRIGTIDEYGRVFWN